MIFVRIITSDSDTVQMIEAESTTAEMATALGKKRQIERDDPTAKVVLYKGSPWLIPEQYQQPLA